MPPAGRQERLAAAAAAVAARLAAILGYAAGGCGVDVAGSAGDGADCGCGGLEAREWAVPAGIGGKSAARVGRELD